MEFERNKAGSQGPRILKTKKSSLGAVILIGKAVSYEMKKPLSE